MKTLYAGNEQYTAEQIMKTITGISGYTEGQEVFAFRGINDFSQFRLEEGQEWDIPEKEQQEAVIAGLAYELVTKDIAIQSLEQTQADTLYQLMVKGAL